MAQRTPFHQQLKYEREQRGWSQQELAKKLDVDPKTVYRWESTSHLPQPLLRRRLCELFGKSAEEFGLLNEQQEQGSGNASM
ncbi:MAG: helix-turn-helix transcriptional regulator, partial [Ktedonobacteraceae bacterium]|nr:helix-turn-helix transcriptional regulator [Ktedonobacteraceae bacterium]